MYCWRIVNRNVCLVAVRLCIPGGLWNELCVWLQWGYVLLTDCELICVSVCSEVIYWWRIVNLIVCGYVLLADIELNSFSGCGEFMYSWRIVNWTLCVVAVKLCTAGGLWTQLCAWLRWGYALVADCELNCVSGCGEVMYSWRILNWTPLWHSSSKLKRN